MKKKILFGFSLVVGIALLSLAAEPAGGKNDPVDAIHELRAQIIELRAEVTILRQQTQTLESTVEQLKRPQMPTPLDLQPRPAAPAPSALLPSPSPSRPPTIWGQGEVNVWTYYIVPCEQQSR